MLLPVRKLLWGALFPVSYSRPVYGPKQVKQMNESSGDLHFYRCLGHLPNISVNDVHRLVDIFPPRLRGKEKMDSNVIFLSCPSFIAGVMF